ncbi:hypothetical protein N0V88_007240 [Collariella sp. IMI 366227]|nr:hypothetical protein N0V88_007240 [Collariella sp. IMI 366227]
MKVLLLVVFATAVGLARTQGVTDKISPPGDAPAGCEASTDGKFEISIVPLSSPAARALAVEKRDACLGTGTLVLSLADSVLTDSLGRTGYIADNFQFQFDNPPQAGALFTAGFSHCANRTLAIGSSTVFYQCRSGSFYNLYDRWWAEQCEPVEVIAVPCGDVEKAAPGPGETVVGSEVVTTTVVMPLSDGQPQVVTTTTVVYICQIGDGQIQGHTTPCTGAPPSPQPPNTQTGKCKSLRRPKSPMGKSSVKMSEYWKSTPKYWCKHCSVFVRETKLERTNHESTGKHQGAVKRALRDLHRNADQKERENDRAKREVERLNGIVSGSSTSGPSTPRTGDKSRAGAYGALPQQALQGDRQKQLEQLAELGVNIPTELRGGMAMAGEWTVTATRVIEDPDQKAEDKEGGSAEARATGVKRERERTEEEKEQEEAIRGLFKKPRRWGVDSKTMPTEEDAELEALLRGPLVKKKEESEVPPIKVEEAIKTEGPVKAEEGHNDAAEPDVVEPAKQEASPIIKQEAIEEKSNANLGIREGVAQPLVGNTTNRMMQAWNRQQPVNFPSSTTVAPSTPGAVMNGSIDAGLIPPRAHLKERNADYKKRYKAWLGGTDGYPYAPLTWPPGRCMLTRLPDELLLMVCDPLYQADLFHLAVTSRRLAGITLDMLYTRDISDFDCLSLRWACTFGIVATLERALSYGARPDHPFHPQSHVGCSWVIGAGDDAWSCDTPLKTAIIANEPEIVRRLLSRGIDVNARDHKVPDLRMAKRCDLLFPINFAMARLVGATVPVETVKLLLERGAVSTLIGSFSREFPYPRNRRISGHCWDRSPLGLVLFFSSVSDIFPLDFSKIRLLLAHGGLNERSYIDCGGGATYELPMLHRYWNHRRIADVLKLFIAENVELWTWAYEDIPPLHSLLWWLDKFLRRAEGGKEEGRIWGVVDKVGEIITILAEATLFQTGSSKKSPIIDATPEMMGCFNERSFHGGRLRYTPLSCLCFPFRLPDATRLIPLLLRYGADVNSIGPEGRKPLHLAAMFSCGGRMQELLKYLGGPPASGLLIDPRDRRGWTPLHYACLFGLWNEPLAPVVTARLLLQNGANVRARTHNGWTPLALAVIAGNPWLVGLLLDCGAHLRDLFIPRAAAAGAESAPTLVQVGRILIVRRDRPYWPGSVVEMADELAVAKASVASLLEYRLGIPVPLVAPQQDLDSDYTPLRYPSQLSLPLNGVEYHFGMSTVKFEAFNTAAFEDEIDGVVGMLDRYSRVAWIVSVHDPPRAYSRWGGVGPPLNRG